jgi:LDH2 family malate/lactate/ureidoglycolate dehydrogenase
METSKVQKTGKLPGEDLRAVLVAERVLRNFCAALLGALGVARADAELAADVFVQSDLRGEESHGMRLFLKVACRLQMGGDRADTQITVIHDKGATALLDANRSLGQVVACRAMQMAIDKAREYGIGVVGVRNANSYTSAKYYPLMAAAQGMVGISYANSGVQIVAPHGASTPIVGTNPVAIAAPADEEFPFVLDMAVSTAMEKVSQAHEQAKSIPQGWALDADGNETTDATKAKEARTLMPWGGYKGFGLGLAHEMLTSILMGGHLFGGGSTGFLPYDAPMNVSQHFQAINISQFVPLKEFKANMDRALRAVKSAKVRPGFAEVHYPGEKGFREHEHRAREGIPMQGWVFDKLNAMASALNAPSLVSADILHPVLR